MTQVELNNKHPIEQIGHWLYKNMPKHGNENRWRLEDHMIPDEKDRMMYWTKTIITFSNEIDAFMFTLKWS